MLAAVFDAAWEKMKQSGGPLAADGNATAARERLAKHIIATAQGGEKDPKKLLADVPCSYGRLMRNWRVLGLAS